MILWEKWTLIRSSLHCKYRRKHLALRGTRWVEILFLWEVFLQGGKLGFVIWSPIKGFVIPAGQSWVECTASNQRTCSAMTVFNFQCFQDIKSLGMSVACNWCISTTKPRSAASHPCIAKAGKQKWDGTQKGSKEGTEQSFVNVTCHGLIQKFPLTPPTHPILERFHGIQMTLKYFHPLI